MVQLGVISEPLLEVVADGQTKSGQNKFAIGKRVTWIALALVPPLSAVLTWDPLQVGGVGQAAARLFGLPSIAVELWVIVYAIHVGSAPIQSLRSQPTDVQLLLSALLAIASATAAIAAPNANWAITFTFISVVHLFFGLSFAHLASTSDTRQLEALWAGIALGCCVYAAIMMFYIRRIGASFDWLYFGLAVTNIRQTGFYSVVGAAATLGLATTRSTRRSTALWSGLAAICLFISFWSGTRSSLVAIAVGFALSLCLLKQLRTVRSSVAFLSSFIAGALLSLCAPSPNSLLGVTRLAHSAGERTFNGISSGRDETWASAWSAILRRPLFGYGEGQYRFAVRQTLAGGLNHPHDIFLQLLLQWGAVGTVITLTLGTFMVFRVHQALKEPRMSDASALLMASSLAVYSLYEGALFHTYPTMMFVLAVAVLLGTRRGRLSRPEWKNSGNE